MEMNFRRRGILSLLVLVGICVLFWVLPGAREANHNDGPMHRESAASFKEKLDPTASQVPEEIRVRVEGAVSDLIDSSPISGAVVDLISEEGVVTSAVADASGEFSLVAASVAPSAWVEASADGYASTKRAVALHGRRTNLLLRPVRCLSLSVRGRRSNALAFDAAAISLSGHKIVSGDVVGTTSLCGFASGEPYSLRIDAPGHRRFSLQHLVLDEDRDITVVLESDLRVTGNARLETSGVPLASATIRFERKERLGLDSGAASATSNGMAEGGLYYCDLASAGTFLPVAILPDGRQLESVDPVVIEPISERSIVRDLVFRDVAQETSVRVVDEAGSAIAGATIEIGMRDGHRVAVTGTDGVFTFDLASAEGLVVSASGFGSTTLTIDDIRLTRTIVLTALCRGGLVLRFGPEWSDSEVDLSISRVPEIGPGKGARWNRHALASDATIALTALSCGWYEIDARCPKGETFAGPTRVLVQADAEASLEMEASGSFHLEGVVRSEKDEGMYELVLQRIRPTDHVALYDVGMTVSDDAGRFLFAAGVGPGSYRLIARGHGVWGSTLIHLDSDDAKRNHVEVFLRDPASVRGKVSNPPYETSVVVTLLHQGEGTHLQCIANSLGEFRFDGVVPGHVLLECEGAAVRLDLAPGETRFVDLELDDEIDVELRVPRPPTHGRALVVCYQVDDPRSAATVWGRSRTGSLAFRMSPGRYFVDVTFEGGRGRTLSRFARVVDIFAGEQERVHVDVIPGRGEIFGHALSSAAESLVGCTISAIEISGVRIAERFGERFLRLEQLSDENGAFRFGALARGKYRLTFEDGSGGRAVRIVDLDQENAVDVGGLVLSP